MICVQMISRRKTWFLCVFVALLLAFSYCLFGSSPANAYNLGDGGSINLLSGKVSGETNGYDEFPFRIDVGPNNAYNTKFRAEVRDTGSLSAFALERIHLTFDNDFVSYLPSKGIYHFTIRYQSLSSSEELGYMGMTPTLAYPDAAAIITSDNPVLLGSNCVNLRYSNNGTYNGDIQCDYYVYYSYRPVGSIGFNFKGYVYYPAHAVGVVDVQPNIDFVEVNDVSGGDISGISADLTVVLNRMQTIIGNQNIMGDELRTIESLMRTIQSNQLTPEDISDGVSDGVSSALDDVKDDIQDASDEAESQANTSGAQSQAQGQTLISIISGFISAITDPTGGSCVIDVDLSLYQGGTHNLVDLCHLNPPSGITTVLSILLIVFVIRAVVHVIQAMIALYREYQS